MAEVFHERLKSPIPTSELERRSAVLVSAMKEADLDCILAPNVTQYMCGANRWITDTTAENQYPQSSFISKDGDIGYIACSGPPLDLYPPSHLLRIGKPWDALPYFSVFNYTWDWEGKLFGRWIEENSPKRVGIAGMNMIHWNYLEYLESHYPAVEFVDASDLFDSARSVKSQAEQAFLKKSASVLDKVMGYLPAVAQPGANEYEVRSKAMQLVTDLGGEEMVILLGSAPQGEAFELLPGFFQNRTLQTGDALYVRLECSGPGGMFTTLGRTFSIGCEPTAALLAQVEAAQAAHRKLLDLLQPGSDPAAAFAAYNAYLKENGYREEEGLFAYGQGYDFIERPSLQPGETMLLKENMCLAVNTSLVNAKMSAYCADSYILTADGPQRLSKTPHAVFRT